MKKVLGMMVAISSLAIASVAVAADVEKGKEAYKTAKCACATRSQARAAR